MTAGDYFDRNTAGGYHTAGGSHSACAHHHRSADFTLPGAEAHYPPDLEIEPIHLDINLRVDIEERCASGTITHTLAWRRAGARTLSLHAVAFEQLEVEDLDGHPMRWRYDGACIHVTWAEGAERGATRRLAIRYRCLRPASGLFFSSPTGPHALGPDAACFAATDHETERARHWLPTIDLPSVRPTLSFHLRAKAELTILANGLLESEELHDDGTKTAHWRLDQPCPSYLTCFAIGDFVRLDDGECDGVELAYFASKQHDRSHLSRTFGGTAEIMRWMTGKLGARFPYPKYYQFALPHFGGAMENISLVSWDDQFLLDETLAGEWGRLIDQINVHEMAHSWFGDLVVCRDYAHAWLKESWATYMEVCWFEDVLGPDEALYERWLCARGYFREADSRYKRPIVTREYHSSWELYDMHLYPGGALRLHSLRRLLGDELFWEGTREYLQEYAGKVVETDDFRRVMERVSGRSLGKFFDQWFHSPGYPALEVDFDWDDAHARGTFTIKQTQVDKPAGVGLFCFPLTLAWTIDGETQRRQVQIERERHSFVFEMEHEPDMVRVDPDFDVVHKLEFDPGSDKLETQLVSAPDVLGRIQAGIELAKQGKPHGVHKLADRWTAERFWGVRLEWARALGHAGTAAALEALRHALEVETDLRVLEGLVRSCAEIRDPKLAAAVIARFGAGGLPHRAAAVAWELLGAQRDKAPFDLIAAAAERPTYNGIEQSGALRGLAATRDERALDLLMRRTEPGLTSNRARPAAVLALGVLARRLDKRPRERAIERLVDLLRDGVQRVQFAAVAGLEAARASEALAQLEAFRETITHQEAVRVDQVIAGLRRSEEPRLVAAEKELEELREKLRKLEDRLERLDARVTGEGD
ncbi:MAG: M1 family aminopeptidase [Enhygromyxa sp.]